MALRAVFIVTLLFVSFYVTRGIELTFELPDSSKQCFHELIEKNVSSILEFQVVGGGQYDIDVTIQAPDKKIIYRQIRKQYNKHTFTPPLTGIYAICFDNEFSTFSHKLVYMRLQVGPELGLPPYLDNLHVMSLMETSVKLVHEKLANITGLQTRYRLREAQGRRRAEELNERVMWWSIGETIAIVLVVLGEVLALKNLFPDIRLPDQLNGMIAMIFAFFSIQTAMAYLMFNFLGGMIAEQHDAVRDAIYGLDWTGASPSFKRSMLIMMSRANVPLDIKPTGLDPLSLKNFGEVSKMAYKTVSTLKGFVQ